MGLRELKEAAHAQYVRGKFEQCARTYQQILKLAPKDPNMRVRHAEACRRAGDKQQAITSYRMAADLLLSVGCESRARGAIKAALELEPKDPVLLADLARLGPSGTSSIVLGLGEERAPAASTPPRGPGLALPPAPAAKPTAWTAPPASPPVTPAPSPEKGVRLQAEVRRLSPQAIAFRLSPQSRWVLFTSCAPISVSREDSLEPLQRKLRDFTLDITVEEPLDEDSLH